MEPPPHMISAGVSAPDPPRHGRGRKPIEVADHLNSHIGGGPPESLPRPYRGHIVPVDHLKAHSVLEGAGGAAGGGRPATPGEVKGAVRGLLASGGLRVYNEAAWGEVEVLAKGTAWGLCAITPQGKELTCEGTARKIVDKLASTPIQDLRAYGILFAERHATEVCHRGKAEIVGAAGFRVQQNVDANNKCRNIRDSSSM
mmetsp:Transcript_108709/g.307471  ORF Transcript_108709/g.307471 Transcript_108709/m.307471 type:complete len:200 (+) Transcript_108709:53-652(+)